MYLSLICQDKNSQNRKSKGVLWRLGAKPYCQMEIKHMILFARRGGVSFSNLQGRRGMFFIKTGGVLAG